MFCRKCGTSNTERTIFCIKCGADLKTKLSSSTSNSLKSQRNYPKTGDSIGDTGAFVKPGQEVESVGVGYLVAGRYEILSKGIRGGMGVVYRCLDIKLDKVMALKLVHPRLTQSKQPLPRFRHEMSIWQELQQKNIVKVYNLDEWDGIEFFIMEWVEGKNLREILNERKKKDRPFTLEEVHTIISQLSDALHHVHQRMTHCDIKPENILITQREDGIHVKLTPSQFMLKSLQTGTPYYMAPEQEAEAAHVDYRADIYAVASSAI